MRTQLTAQVKCTGAAKPCFSSPCLLWLCAALGSSRVRWISRPEETDRQTDDYKLLMGLLLLLVVANKQTSTLFEGEVCSKIENSDLSLQEEKTQKPNLPPGEMSWHLAVSQWNCRFGKHWDQHTTFFFFFSFIFFFFPRIASVTINEWSRISKKMLVWYFWVAMT